MNGMSREQYIIERLDEIADKVSKIEGKLASMPLQSHQAWMKSIDETLKGNGKPGINVRLDRLERARSIKDRALWLLFGTFITSIGAITVALLS